MSKKNILTLSLIFSIITIIFGALLKIMHYPEASLLLPIALLVYLVFMVTALIEVFNSTKIEGTEKLMWTVGFFFFGTITGLIYMLSARNRIV